MASRLSGSRSLPGGLLATRKARRAVLQAGAVAGLAGLFALLLANLLQNLDAEGHGISFAFLLSESGFDVNESAIPYDAGSSYLMAFVVGLLNTLHLTLVGVFCATAIGMLVGMIRIGGIVALNKICRLYIESMRNLPKLLILLAVYVLLVLELPVAREALSLFDIVFLSNRGLNVPALAIDLTPLSDSRTLAACGLYGMAVGAAWLSVRRRRSGILLRHALPVALVAIGLVAISGVVTIELPAFRGFNFAGGSVVSIPFFSLAVALSLYQGAQVAEVVRSGIQSVPSGQAEAGAALGLRQSQLFWLVVMPQAMRVMIPPLTNQYLNLLKNTSIGLAVGYSDLVSIMNTSINQTFRPVELMMVTMLVYLTVGVGASILLNRFNRRVQLKER